MSSTFSVPFLRALLSLSHAYDIAAPIVESDAESVADDAPAMSAMKAHNIKNEDIQDDIAEADEEEDDDEDEETYVKRAPT